MKTFQHFGTRVGPLQTADASLLPRNIDAAISSVQTAMENRVDAIDIGRIIAILSKYSAGGSVGKTNSLGVTTAGDTDHAARHAADGFHREVAHNRKVAKGYADFWKEKSLASLQRYGSRR
jgi:hypothetical protein